MMLASMLDWKSVSHKWQPTTVQLCSRERWLDEASLLSSPDTIMAPTWHREANRLTEWGTNQLKEFFFWFHVLSMGKRSALSWWVSSSWGFNDIFLDIQKVTCHTLPGNQGNSISFRSTFLYRMHNLNSFDKINHDWNIKSYITNVQVSSNNQVNPTKTASNLL